MGIDLNILESVKNGAERAFCIWEPVSTMVVTGRGANPDKEAFVEQCRIDNIPIIRRRTGGGTVVLSPGMLVVSLASRISAPLAVREYTDQASNLIINFLEQFEVKDLHRRGLADICIGNRKIFGSGMYMSRNFIFFQGSLLVNPDLDLFDRYLRHPHREPDYRKGRKHSDFVTSLNREGYNFAVSELIPELREFLDKNLDKIK
jgi:lipoate---protein ligase